MRQNRVKHLLGVSKPEFIYFFIFETDTLLTHSENEHNPISVKLFFRTETPKVKRFLLLKLLLQFIQFRF